MENLTKQAVCDVAQTLINTNGSTTSLDVKQGLRIQNYWADQSTVSGHLQELAEEHDWDVTTGRFNTYRLSEEEDDEDDAAAAAAAQNVAPVVTLNNNPSWVAFSNDGDNPRILSVDTRSKARTAYAKSTGLHYNQVRARLQPSFVKNYGVIVD